MTALAKKIEAFNEPPDAAPGTEPPEPQDFVPTPGSIVEAKIAELAKMGDLDYQLARVSAAESLALRVAFLDKKVAENRTESAGSGQVEDPFEAVEPWGEKVDGASLLAELLATIRRFCVLPDHSAPLMAAWVLHAWAHDAADISPLLAFVSPEKRCGKSTALLVIGALAPKAMHSVNITSAVLFRVVEKYGPTILVDEGDTFLTENEELRGILNGGHNRLTAFVWRIVGDDHEPRQFRVWSPKCIAMIGKLPDTLEDRSLVIQMRRKQAGEVVERFRADRMQEFLPLRRKAARWAADNLMSLREMDPHVPEELNDRAQDNARAICSIADLAGGIWPKLIRASLTGAAAQMDDEPQSAGIDVVARHCRYSRRETGDRIGSSELLTALCAIKESPWGDWRHGSSISPRGVANSSGRLASAPAAVMPPGIMRDRTSVMPSRGISPTDPKQASQATQASPEM